jgi:hypothetical protein
MVRLSPPAVRLPVAESWADGPIANLNHHPPPFLFSSSLMRRNPSPAAHVGSRSMFVQPGHVRGIGISPDKYRSFMICMAPARLVDTFGDYAMSRPPFHPSQAGRVEGFDDG